MRPAVFRAAVVPESSDCGDAGLAGAECCEPAGCIMGGRFGLVALALAASGEGWRKEWEKCCAWRRLRGTFGGFGGWLLFGVSGGLLGFWAGWLSWGVGLGMIYERLERGMKAGGGSDVLD